MKKDNKQRLFEVMQRVDPTFKQINENIDEGWKDVAAGVMMSAASMLPMKAGAQTQSAPVDNKPTTELTQDSQKQVYAFVAGIAAENSSQSLQNRNIDAAGAYKEIAKYYQDLLKGAKPLPLSQQAIKYLSVIKEMMKKLDKQTVDHFIQMGMSFELN